VDTLINREQLTTYLNEYLKIDSFKDYGPNGLQIEGRETVERVGFAVSATKQSIEEAIRNKVDTLIVHHGLFWSFHGIRTITGPFARRVKPLITNNINLIGYHLPLDAHHEVGNAAAIANKLELVTQKPFGDHKGSPTGIQGELPKPLKAKELKVILEKVLDHDVIISTPNPDQVIQNIGIITGGANGDWIHAEANGLDAYLTGEISEHDWHEAKEAGIHMFAGGHNATERFGVQELMAHLEEKFHLECLYFDSPNPA